MNRNDDASIDVPFSWWDKRFNFHHQVSVADRQLILEEIPALPRKPRRHRARLVLDYVG
jgi:hypothetical protein